MPNYRHSPLPPGSIRLLQLLPGNENSTSLRCRLLVCSLRRSTGPTRPYEALSYVWGSTENLKSIAITDDHNVDQEFAITQNLHGALHQLQDFELARLLWVDALCIDQSSNAEKSIQIALMAEIYANASRVIVWLDEARADDQESLVEHVANGCEALEAIRLAASGQPSRIQGSQKRAISMLLNRQWFQRIWVRESPFNFFTTKYSRFCKKPLLLAKSTLCVGMVRLMDTPSAWA
jgi:hypothetical protein